MNQEKNKGAEYDFYGKLPLQKAILLGLQHVFAMFVGNLTPVLIITGACGIASGTEFADVQIALLQNAMLIAGIVTLIQLYAIGPIGGKVPIIMGTSSGFIGVCSSVASVMGGGIVGRIGEAVLLSVDADQPDGQEINKKDALVRISNCVNTGDLSYEKPKKGDGVTEEEFQKAAETYWKASMGGILGDCSCTNGYSVNFENCTYHTERGIGNTELPDIE